MDDAHYIAAQRAGQRRFYATLVGTPDTQVRHFDGGVQALLTPGAIQVSFLNGVVYEDGPALVAALDDLDEMYVAAGVKAWTVWVHHDDPQTAAACEAKGHKLDGTPALMGAELGELDLEPRREVEITTTPEWATIGDLNAVAYGGQMGGQGGVMAGMDPPDYVVAIARRDGAAVACAGGQITDGNCEVALVATDPSARRQGLAMECTTAVLRQALAAGARTTTLEATALGEPVYARIGYRAIGRLTMWERRLV